MAERLTLNSGKTVELPLERDVRATLSNTDIVEIAIRAYGRVVSGYDTLPETGWIADQIAAQTNVPPSAAGLVALSRPTIL